jgi:hypothetical protein
LLLGRLDGIDRVKPHLTVVVDGGAVIHGHDIDHVDPHAIILGALQHVQAARHQPGRQHRQRERDV